MRLGRAGGGARPPKEFYRLCCLAPIVTGVLLPVSQPPCTAITAVRGTPARWDTCVGRRAHGRRTFLRTMASSLTAAAGTEGYWPEPGDAVCSDASKSLANVPLVSPPGGWPDCFKENAKLKAFVRAHGRIDCAHARTCTVHAHVSAATSDPSECAWLLPNVRSWARSSSQASAAG